MSTNVRESMLYEETYNLINGDTFSPGGHSDQEYKINQWVEKFFQNVVMRLNDNMAKTISL